MPIVRIAVITVLLLGTALSRLDAAGVQSKVRGGNTPQELQSALTHALDTLSKGGVLDAIRQLKQIVHAYPGFGAAYFYLAQVYTQMNDLPDAEDYLNRAMALGMEQRSCFYQLGLIRRRESKWSEALTLFERAVKAGADGAAVWRNIGDANIELFNREKALEAYERALSIGPNDPKTRVALGFFYLDRDVQRAVLELRAAVALQPDLPGALPALARAYRRLGDMQASIGILRKAVALNPHDQESRYSLAQALLLTGHEEEGQKEMEAYDRVRSRVERADRSFDLATTKLEAGQLAEGEKILREAVELAPTFAPALLALGTVLLDRGNPREAAKVLRNAAVASPLNAAVQFRLGTAYLQLHELTDALDATKRAIVLDEEAPYYRQLGKIHTMLGQPDQAQQVQEMSVQMELGSSAEAHNP